MPLIQPLGRHATPRMLRLQPLQILSPARQNSIWICDQLAQHRPMQPQRAFLIPRQVALA